MSQMSEMVNLSKRAALAAKLQRLQETVENSGVPTHKYLSFNAQRGEFYVRENDNETPVPVGTKFAVNWEEVTHGYVCWKDGKVHDSVSWKILSLSTLPEPDLLPDHGPYTDDDNKKDGWKKQISIPLKDLKTNVEYIFKTGPPSAVNTVSRFIAQLRDELHLRLNNDKSEDVNFGHPVVTIGKGFFVPNGRTNRVFTPKFTLEAEWLKDDSFTMMAIKGVKDGVYSRALIEGDHQKSAMITGNVTDVTLEE